MQQETYAIYGNIEQGLSLPVMEAFYTIQGEGHNTGRAAYFIRLGGCDIGCRWCDVKESWPAAAHPVYSAAGIAARAAEYPSRTVVITGGEPCMYDLRPLTALLKEKNITVFLETSGAYEIKGEFDWICVSPKKFKAPAESALKQADELKVVVFNKHDFKWAEENAEHVTTGCKLYLQPEWEKRNEVAPLIVDYVRDNPKWLISLQTHKYLNIP